MFTDEELLDIRQMIAFCFWKSDLMLGIPYDRLIELREKIDEYIAEREES